MSIPKIALIIVSVLLVIACVIAVHYYQAYMNIFPSTPQGLAAQTKAVVAEVGQLMVLPQGETPSLASVVDPAALQSQPFFANAKKGDFVLVYANAGEAILYDPSMDKIVEVAPITSGTSPSGVVTAPAAGTSTAASSNK